MKGVQHIEVSNRDAKFEFDLYRNITIINGDSGTGKTTLFNMIVDYTRNKENSGVNLSCDKKCIALLSTNNDWISNIKKIKDSIVFIDEGSRFITSREFAKTIKKTDNYYVLFTREEIHELPYSVEEIYEIKSSKKYHTLVKRYKEKSSHYYINGACKKESKIEVVFVEDQKSGYEFYNEYFKNMNIKCVSTKANSYIFKYLCDNLNKNLLIVADGAAFGSQMNKIELLIANRKNIFLCLPESFEWLILKSGLINKKAITNILNNPSNYIDSNRYFSWEEFFTDCLCNESKNGVFEYSKKRLNRNYLIKKNSNKILKEILDI